jgi:thiamine biosynthesis lipoprotein
MTLTELAFPAMGTSVRLLAAPGAPLHEARCLIEDLEARLTRFDPSSELSVLNADPREAVPASRPLRDAITAAIAAAVATGGLADPTLLGAVVRAGYDRSLVGHPRADLHDALAAAPEPRPAAPAPAADWRRVRVDDAAGTVARPPGVHLDLGGSAKGLAADLATELLAPHGPCAADLGGDLRVSGAHEVLVPNPVTGMLADVIELDDDAVATSGIDKRIWWDAADRPAHHLLDPATGRPAWTGVLSATAKAPTAALAEALAKAAILAGPNAGRRILSRYGGLLITTQGAVLTANIEGLTLNVEGQTPNVEGQTLHVEGQTPNVEGLTLHVEGQTPNVEGQTPRGVEARR